MQRLVSLHWVLEGARPKVELAALCGGQTGKDEQAGSRNDRDAL